MAGGVRMKLLLAMAMGAALLLPAGAAVAGSPAECARYKRQIDHYEGMVERARNLDSELWEGRTQDHVDKLRALQRERCPEDIPLNTTLIAFERLLKLAAKAAVTYFTFGAF